ncbi:cytochrome c oxidase assembly factor 7 homolog [Bacillus rossius redtenbacheri]|uniref:cytochrome c oxidase assembly factor 7 homolog n=1 Tax=Bacillus rossius redtenbacheri TaxID=93214 RepID=UPI002FDCEDB3
MAYDFKEEKDVKEFLENLGIEYRFGCYHEKKPEVCHLLGDYLESIKKDYEKAGKVYKTNCEDYSFPRSCYKIGNYTVIGKGKQKEDHGLAFDYYLKGCNLGEADACLNAGLLLTSKNTNVQIEKKHAQGVALLERGCSLNHAYCCHFVSGIFISGIEEASISKNMEKAFKYGQKACELGNMYACANVSQMYMRGEGTAKNLELGEKFKKLAIEMRDEIVKKKPTLTFQQGTKPV